MTQSLKSSKQERADGDMTNSSGRPLGSIVWHDLMTTDADSARRFYAALLGWRIDESGLIHAGEPHIARIQPARPGESARWIPYLEVDDPDSLAEQAAAAGATITVPGTDIPGVGRFAELEDPEGAAFRLWRARPDPTVPPAPGRVWWNQLIARDPAAARDFYAAAIGWTPLDQTSAETGPYTIFLDGEAAVAGIYPVPIPDGANARPHWQPFFWVDDCRAAVARAIELGGVQYQQPTFAAGVGTLAVIGDPDGADFLLITPEGPPA